MQNYLLQDIYFANNFGCNDFGRDGKLNEVEGVPNSDGREWGVGWGRATTRLLRTVLRRVLKTTFEKVLLRRCLATANKRGF